MHDVRLVAMTDSDAGVELVYGLKREALGPHIVQVWGWNASLQRATVARNVRAGHYFKIVVDELVVGTIAVNERGDHMEIDDFYILPHHQRQGIGTCVMKQVAASAQTRGLPICLITQRWNPAVSLYKRHGFAVVQETETHVHLQRLPAENHG
jgi:ribosomal protein S18 acetylase RimI-like enzyme